MLLVDGRIIGVWSYEVKGDRVAVAVEPFGRVGRDVRGAIEAEAERLAAFLGGEVQLAWT